MVTPRLPRGGGPGSPAPVLRRSPPARSGSARSRGSERGGRRRLLLKGGPPLPSALQAPRSRGNSSQGVPKRRGRVPPRCRCGTRRGGGRPAKGADPRVREPRGPAPLPALPPRGRGPSSVASRRAPPAGAPRPVPAVRGSLRLGAGRSPCAPSRLRPLPGTGHDPRGARPCRGPACAAAALKQGACAPQGPVAGGRAVRPESRLDDSGSPVPGSRPPPRHPPPV